MSCLDRLLEAIASYNGINDKSKLSALLAATFGLTRDRSVFYCDDFAIRFSSSANKNFSNTVLSLSNLQKVDHLPFLRLEPPPNLFKGLRRLGQINRKPAIRRRRAPYPPAYRSAVIRTRRLVKSDITAAA